MANCVSCGIEIPDGQRVCSVCYGDPYYGSDGHLLNLMEAEAQEAAAREHDRQLEEEYRREQERDSLEEMERDYEQERRED